MIHLYCELIPRNLAAGSSYFCGVAAIVQRFALAVSALLIWSLCVAPLSADYVLTISTASLANNATNQRIQVFLAWNGVGSPNVAGFDLFTEIRNPTSAPLVPVFSGANGGHQGFGYSSQQNLFGTVLASSPTIWDTILNAGVNSDTVTLSGTAPEAGNSRRASIGVLTSNLTPFTFSANSPQLIAEYSLNTTGVFDRQFEFFIGASGGAGSDVVLSDAASQILNDVSFAFFVGNVTAVPEPASLGLFAACSLLSLTSRKLRLRLFTSHTGNGHRDQQ